MKSKSLLGTVIDFNEIKSFRQLTLSLQTLRKNFPNFVDYEFVLDDSRLIVYGLNEKFEENFID